MLCGPRFDGLEGKWDPQSAKFRRFPHVVEDKNTRPKIWWLHTGSFPVYLPLERPPRPLFPA